MPRVSVIIPAYNRAGFLPEAVGSVLSQTFGDFEVIVVDDGSTDNTPEVIKRFPPEVRCFRQENGGSGSARNLGIEHARGEYLVFLDSDDVLFEDALEKGVACLDCHPEVALCYGQVYSMDINGNVIWWKRLRGEKKSCVRDGKEQIARLVFRGDMQVAAVMVRRRCLDEVGLFDTSRALGEDIDMWLRLCRKFPVAYLAEPLGKYRIHSQSATECKKFEELEKAQTEFVERALHGLESDPSYRRLRRKARFGLYCYLAEEAARAGHRAQGFRYTLQAVRASPTLLLHKDGDLFMLMVARSFLPKWFRWPAKRMLQSVKHRGEKATRT